MPIIQGWEVSQDRIEIFTKMITTDPLGEPIITSKCVLDSENGLLVVGENGFSWKLKIGFKQMAGRPSYRFGPGMGRYQIEKHKWVRWCDVSNVIPKRDGQVIVELKIRKGGALIYDKKGRFKVKKWKLTIRQNKGEDKTKFKARLSSFNSIMIDIFNKHRVQIDPPSSDSRL